MIVHSREFYPINSKLCRNNGKGFWDSSDSSCYYNFNAKEICIVIDTNYFPVGWYRQGCDNKGFIKKEAIVWVTSDEFVDFGFNVTVNVRSLSDPFVFASYNSLYALSPSSSEYVIIGSVLVGVCALMLCMPVWYCYLKKKKKKYLEMDF